MTTLLQEYDQRVREAGIRAEAACVRRRAEENEAGRLRESGPDDGLIDLGPGVPKPWKPMTAADRLRESQLDDRRDAQALEAMREGELIELDGIPKPERMREIGTYGLPGKEVAFENGSEYADLCDLFTVLPMTEANGTPSLENRQCEALAETLQNGQPLSDSEVGILRELLDRHKAELEALRASPDYVAKSYTDLPTPGTARMVESDRGPLRGLLAPPPPPEEEVVGPDGLIDLGPGVPRPLPAFMSVGYGRPPAEPTPTVSRMRSSAGEGLIELDGVPKPVVSPMREAALAEVALLHRYNREVSCGRPRRIREARGRRTPGDPNNLTMKEVRELCQEWEGVAA